MSKTRRNYFKALVLVGAVSVAAASTASGQGYAGPVVTPQSLDFGSVLVGTTSAVQTLTVSVPPAGEGFPALSIVSIAVPAGFVRSGGSCPASGTATSPCTIGVAFAPGAVGPANGNVVVTASINGGQGVGTNAAVVGIGVPGVSVAAPSLSTWGLGLLLAALMATGIVYTRKR